MSMTLAKIEFAVQMTCGKCVNKIKESLSGVKGIENISISLENESVIVETILPSSEIQQRIESTGRRAVLKGYGGSGNKGAAVAMLGDSSGCGFGMVKGIVRFIQTDDDTCVVDGTLDGLSPGLHGLHIHECGDISNGCESVGEHYNPRNTRHGSPDNNETDRLKTSYARTSLQFSTFAYQKQGVPILIFHLGEVKLPLKWWSSYSQLNHAGDLGNIKAGPDGRATFRLTDKVVKVYDVIGRSLVVTDQPDDLGEGYHPHSLVDGNSGLRLACGIIARSAGMFENSKRICACDGVTLWDERDRPLAGPGRRKSNM